MDNLNAFYKGDYATGKTDLRELRGKTFIPNECVLMLCMEGRSVVSINSRKEIIRKGDLVVLFSDMIVSSLQISSRFSADFLVFSHNFMEKVYYDLTSDSFWRFIFDYHILHLSDEQYDLMDGWFRQMKWIMDNGDEGNRIAILRSNLYNLFLLLDDEMSRIFPEGLRENEKDSARRGQGQLLCEQEQNQVLRKLEQSQSCLSYAECSQKSAKPSRLGYDDPQPILSKDRARMLFGRFMSLLVKNCNERREVAWYADRLCITKGYLYKICCKIEHRTPKELIENVVVNKIKQYLSDTELSVTDIAREFHFEDSSYLARFFRRVTGMSPLDYRGR